MLFDNENDQEFLHFKSDGLVDFMDNTTLRTHDLVTIEWRLKSFIPKSMSTISANKKMEEYIVNKNNLKIKNAMIHTTNNYRIHAYTN